MTTAININEARSQRGGKAIITAYNIKLNFWCSVFALKAVENSCGLVEA